MWVLCLQRVLQVGSFETLPFIPTDLPTYYPLCFTGVVAFANVANDGNVILDLFFFLNSVNSEIIWLGNLRHANASTWQKDEHH